MLLLDLPDPLTAGDINAVCESCGSPELFCDCSDALKRQLEGWD